MPPASGKVLEGHKLRMNFVYCFFSQILIHMSVNFTSCNIGKMNITTDKITILQTKYEIFSLIIQVVPYSLKVDPVVIVVHKQLRK